MEDDEEEEAEEEEEKTEQQEASSEPFLAFGAGLGVASAAAADRRGQGGGASAAGPPLEEGLGGLGGELRSFSSTPTLRCLSLPDRALSRCTRPERSTICVRMLCSLWW